MEGAGAAAIVPDAPLLNMMAAAAEQVDAAQPDELPAVPTAVGVAPDAVRSFHRYASRSVIRMAARL